MESKTPKLFVGVGNVLKRDDGVGVRAAEVMSSLPLSAEVEVYDAGSVGLEMADVLKGRELVVVVDAIQADVEPGAVFRFAADDLRPYMRTGLSLHDVHLLDALEETRLLGIGPERVVVFAVQVDDVSTGIGLSPAVEVGMEQALVLAIRELGLPDDIVKHATSTTSWSQ